MLKHLIASALFLLSGTITIHAQNLVANPGFEEATIPSLQSECTDIGCCTTGNPNCGECIGCDGYPWQGFANNNTTTGIPQNANYFRIPISGCSSTNGINTQANPPVHTSSDPNNSAYMLMRFTSVQAANNSNTTTMGIVNELIEPITPGCAYDLSLFMAARRGYGYNATSPTPSYEITISVGNDLHMACGSLNVVTGTVITSISGTITHGTTDTDPDSVWSEISSNVVFSEAYNSIQITVKMAGFPTGSKYDIYFDDISLMKQDEACGALCCSPNCLGDLNCDSTVDSLDVILFTTQLFGKDVDEIDPCHAPFDFDSDGVIDVTDNNQFIYLQGPCPCCNATCWADLDCSGFVDAADSVIFFNELVYTGVSSITEPCYALLDTAGDGYFDVEDLLYFIGQFGTNCMSGMNAAPSTARTLDDRIGHVLTATAEPNPGAGQYRIAHQLPGEGAIDITVVDHQGRVVVRRSNADQPTLFLDLQDQQPGTYTAVMVRNGNLSTVHLVKE